MIQHRRKDYLIRLIEELFKKLFQLLDRDTHATVEEKLSVIGEIHTFFHETFNISSSDDSETIINKINDTELLEHYIKILVLEYQISSNKTEDTLYTALEITEYLQNTDSTYSWERNVMREDILRLLDKNNNKESPIT